MDVRAILVIASPETQPAACFAGVPLALLDIAGKTLLQHTAGRFRNFGIEEIAVVCDKRFDHVFHLSPPATSRTMMVEEEGLWGVCESVFNDFAQAGAEVVIVQRLEAYTEINFDLFLQFHLDNKARISQLYDSHGDSLDLMAISASRRNDAAFLLRRRLREFRTSPAKYSFNGLIHRMQHPRDVRRLTSDVLLQRTELRPAGKEIRPGIWAGKNVQLERGARVVAPAYIGDQVKIRAAAVITRVSSIEHHAEIDCGTIIESSNVLPFSHVGAGLDLTNSIVGFNALAQLDHDIEVEIEDRKLLSMRLAGTSRRAKKPAGLAKFAPAQLIRNFFAQRQPTPPTTTEQTGALPDTAEVERKREEPEGTPSTSPTFETEFMTARRYGGDQ